MSFQWVTSKDFTRMLSGGNRNIDTEFTSKPNSFDSSPSHNQQPRQPPSIPFVQRNYIKDDDDDDDQLKALRGVAAQSEALLESDPKPKKHVHRYKADWLVSSVAWSNQSGEPLLALSSFIEEYSNWIDIVKFSKDDFKEEITKVHSFSHPYPPTKISWFPRNPADNQSTKLPQLLATTADYLRIWRLVGRRRVINSSYDISDTSTSGSSNNEPDEYEIKLDSLLNPNKGSKQCAPLTSFDWNEIDPSIIVTSSLDTCCAVWDLEVNKLLSQTQINLSNSSSALTNTTGTSSTSLNDISLSSNLRSQIVAHNHEVYDVSFSRSGSGRDVFASAGGDGSVRMFDLRRLSTSTILFEYDRSVPISCKPIVRVACNKQDSNLIAAFSANSKDIILLDTRRPGIPVGILKSHSADVTSINWNPNSARYLCSGSNDQQALIWDLHKLPEPVEEPFLAYRANGKINATNWSNLHPDWISIGYQNYLELLRV